MMILLSPAKTLENDPVKRDIQLSQPEFIKEANYLVNCLKKLKPTDLAALMSLIPIWPNLTLKDMQHGIQIQEPGITILPY